MKIEAVIKVGIVAFGREESVVTGLACVVLALEINGFPAGPGKPDSAFFLVEVSGECLGAVVHQLEHLRGGRQAPGAAIIHRRSPSGRRAIERAEEKRPAYPIKVIPGWKRWIGCKTPSSVPYGRKKAKTTPLI